MTFVAWPSIKQLHGVVAAVRKLRCQEDMVEFRGKIKLHGTNGAVGIVRDADGSICVHAQSRNRVLTRESDNASFASSLLPHEEYFRHVFRRVAAIHDSVRRVVVYGEWCGPGINSGVALTKLPQKQFCVFSLLVDEMLVSDPSTIADLLPLHERPDFLHVLPWHSVVVRTTPDADASGETAGPATHDDKNAPEQVRINFRDFEASAKDVERVNELVYAIDAVCPWTLATFGVTGNGEGLVWYPVSLETNELWICDDDRGNEDGDDDDDDEEEEEEEKDTVPSGESVPAPFPHLRRKMFARYAFKAKGEAHTIPTKNASTRKQPAQLLPEEAKSIHEYVNLAVTEARLRQGLTEVLGVDYDHKTSPPKKRTNNFRQWILADVQKEMGPELEAANLTWQQVVSYVGQRAVQWYINA